MLITTTICFHPCNASSTKSDGSDESRSLLSNAELQDLVQNLMSRFTQASGPVVEHEKPLLLQPPKWEKRKIPKSSGTPPRSDLSDGGDAIINELKLENEQLKQQLDDLKQQLDVLQEPVIPMITKQEALDLFSQTLVNEHYLLKVLPIDNEQDVELLDGLERTQKYELNLKLKCKQLGREREEVEKYLWHGSSFKNTEKIIKNGFDRSYNSRCQYGAGSYFARDSGSSAYEYSTRNKADGYRYISLCKVIVGETRYGSGISRVIPEKEDGTEYDTLVGRDDAKGPQVYSSYRDYMAIPVVRIKFKFDDDP